MVATLSGGSLAITGTMLADHLRHRREDGRGTGERRRAVYIAFISAAGDCHARLRAFAQEPDRAAAASARESMDEAGLYEARERLYIDASAAVAGAGQAMFEQLRSLQRTVAAGAVPDSAEFHAAYHPYIGAVWRYRVAVRQELEGRSLVPEVFGWSSWDGTDRCARCGPAATPGN
jgi:hypothetical protein